MKYDAIMLREQDNVATALRDIQPGESIFIVCNARSLAHPVREFIAYGHKFAVRDIARGEDVIKYGEVMGRAIALIPAGHHAHVQNIESLRGRGDLSPEGERHAV